MVIEARHHRRCSSRVHRCIEAAHEDPPAIRATDEGMREGELLRLPASTRPARAVPQAAARAPVGVMSSSPLKDSPATPSWRWSGGDHRQPLDANPSRCAGRPWLGHSALSRAVAKITAGARRPVAVDHRIAAARGGRRVVDADLVGVGPRHLILAVLRRGGVPGDDRRACLHMRSARPMIASRWSR